MHFLFPDSNPPRPPESMTVDQACIWLLAVMDPKPAGGRRFVAGILSFYLERDYVTDKQLAGLQSILTKVGARHATGDLESQGAVLIPAEEARLHHGKLVPLRAVNDDDGEVLE